MVSAHFGGGLNCDVAEVRSATARCPSRIGGAEAVKVPDNDSKKKAVPVVMPCPIPESPFEPSCPRDPLGLPRLGSGAVLDLGREMWALCQKRLPQVLQFV